jgi:hypothetical protein
MRDRKGGRKPSKTNIQPYLNVVTGSLFNT